MVYYNFQDIPYPFLKNAVLSISKKYYIEKVRTDPYGEALIKTQCKLDKEEVRFILETLTPGGLPKGYTIRYDIDYTQAKTGLGLKTYIFSLNGINYTKL